MRPVAPSRPRFRPARTNRRLRVLEALVLVSVLACGGDEDPASAPDDCTPIRNGKVTLVAEDLAWDVDCLTVAADTEVTLRIDLRDRSVRHNLSISGPSLETVETPLETGPKIQTLAARVGPPGYNQFVCDIHPSMEGDLFVE